MLEETGYESSDWTHLLTIPSNATIADNYAYVFMARKCRKIGEQHLDETECLNVVTHEKLPDVADELFEKTLAKRRLVAEKAKETYGLSDQ